MLTNSIRPTLRTSIPRVRGGRANRVINVAIHTNSINQVKGLTLSNDINSGRRNNKKSKIMLLNDVKKNICKMDAFFRNNCGE